jgi:hypothetical protein
MFVLEKFQTIPMSLCVSVILGIDSSISIAVATATLGYFRVLGRKIRIFIRGQNFNVKQF